MDSIDRAMKEAERLGFGVSYGKYRAAYPDGSQDVVPKPAPAAKSEEPTGVCRCCGKPFVKRHASRTVCSVECEAIVKADRDRQYHRNKKKKDARTIVCAVCGADFKSVDHRRKYCCPKCAAAGKRKQQHLWYAAHKKGNQ